MNYIGSKKSLLSFLDESINAVVGKTAESFCDIFAGTGAVGTYFKRKGYQIIANDIQYYAYVLNRHYIGNHKLLPFNGLVNELSLSNMAIENRSAAVCIFLERLDGISGFIYKNYALGGSIGTEFERMYFSDENAERCDAIRTKIEEWKNAGKITEDEYFFLLATLLEAIDKTANTASVYGAFLKKLKNSAKTALTMQPVELILNDKEHFIYNKDANQLIRKIKSDILYMDPPYNERQYCANYHLLETIAKYDNPVISGKTGLRSYKEQKSKYCSKSSVKEAFKDIVEKACVKYIFLSYNNEGLLDLDDIEEVFSQKGEYGCFKREYSRFKADAKRQYQASKTTEYLHYCICK